MNKFIKIISSVIIIIAFIFSAIITWKVVTNIQQTIRQDLQLSFKDSLIEYGKK